MSNITQDEWKKIFENKKITKNNINLKEGNFIWDLEGAREHRAGVGEQGGRTRCWCSWAG